MQPADLKPSSFAAYPPQAQAFAQAHLETLRALPLVLAPILLRELIAYDWKLPAERRELENQFSFLEALTPIQRTSQLQGFTKVTLPPTLPAYDWVNLPGGFIETLTAWLWSSHQTDAFRDQADSYAQAVNQARPPKPPSKPRLAVVVIGAEAPAPTTPLFRKLRPHGLTFTRLDPQDGLPHILAAAAKRAQGSSPSDFLHWYIDGASPNPFPGLTSVSYADLQPARAHLLTRIQGAIGTEATGPEQLRTLLARLQPADLGLTGTGPAAVLNHFQMQLLTEGAGTQIFATTFVQWAARECIRRAQPETLIVRFSPRQRAQTMNLMLTGASPQGLDLEGSLRDADLGAYYTWLALRRLSGSDQLRFVAWFEGHGQAIAIGPTMAHGTTSDSSLTLDKLLTLL